MKVRLSDRPEITGSASRFNTHGIGSIIVTFTEGDSSDMLISELDVKIQGEWKSMRAAFADRDLVTDNYNQYFLEPPTEEDRKRGYVL